MFHQGPQSNISQSYFMSKKRFFNLISRVVVYALLTFFYVFLSSFLLTYLKPLHNTKNVITQLKLNETTVNGVADVEMLEKVKNMMKHAWNSYERYAWGMDELHPIKGKGQNWASPNGYAATIIDSLDTLYIMDLKEEFRKGRDYVVKNVDFQVNSPVSVFETNIRILGGLLSAYELSQDPSLLKKAELIGNKLLPAFNTTSGIPVSTIILSSGIHTSGYTSILAELGTLQLEFICLSKLTNNPKYEHAALKVIDVISAIPKPHKGLYPTTVNHHSEAFIFNGYYTVGALADSFYEYLLKVWIFDKRKGNFRKLYDESVEAIIEYLVGRAENGSVYIGEGGPGGIDNEMEHLTCFAGGMFALGAHSKKEGNWKEIFQLGKSLTETCYKMYKLSKTGLGAEKTNIDTWESTIPYYILRPETIESIFIMWRLTQDQKYRDWGKEIAESIEKHCRTEKGYVGLKNVGFISSDNYMDKQESFFLAETLKYLYLLFSDNDVISLDEYVFNTEAHPLKILKSN
jgi:mannosyl-oligosaccharide alpha-1,2-mannosidase